MKKHLHFKTASSGSRGRVHRGGPHGHVLCAPRFTKGLLAILVGHVIGCAMFFFAGLIGGRTGRSAMGTVELSFGRIGACFSPRSTCCSSSAGRPS